MDYKEKYYGFKERLQDALPEFRVRGKFSSFYPEHQFIRVDFLKSEDWPHNISDNSVFIDFEISFETNKIEIYRCGCIYLTPEDQKKTFLAMASVKDVNKVYSALVEKSVWMRPVKYKTEEDAVKKITEFISRIKKVLDWSTGGYPYGRLVQNLY